MTREVVTNLALANLSRPARLALFALQLNCEETGEFKGTDGMTAQQRLSQLCGWLDKSAASEAINELEAARLVTRVSHTRRQWLWVLDLSHLDRKREPRACEVCKGELGKLRGAKRCPSCVQVQRREWKADLMEIWRYGQSQGWSDMKIAATAHIRLKHRGSDGVERRIPLWGAVRSGKRGDDRATKVKGEGSGDQEGIVSAGVGLGIFPSSMMDLARRAVEGEGGES